MDDRQHHAILTLLADEIRRRVTQARAAGATDDEIREDFADAHRRLDNLAEPPAGDTPTT
jgi:hypothetical protein